MFFVIISISIYIFGIYLILGLSNCNAIQSTDCHVRYFNKLSIYLSIYLSTLVMFLQAHLLSCDCKIIRCPNHRCHAIMEKRLVEDHVMNTCQWRTLHCGHCSDKYSKCEEEVSVGPMF